MMFTAQLGQSGLFIDDRTCLLLRMEGADGGTTFKDSSCLHRTLHRRRGATTSTAQVATGATSGSFSLGTTNNNGDILGFAENLECVIVDDFTVQAWVCFKTTTPPASPTPTPSGAYTRDIIMFGCAGIYSKFLWIYQSYNNIAFPSFTNPKLFFHGTDTNALYTDAPSTSALHHIALTRYRAAATQKVTMEGWVDGASIGTKDSDSAGIDVNRVFGLSEGESNLAEGYTVTTISGYTSAVDVDTEAGDQYIDELQVINGTALYRDGVSFTPPAYEL